MPQIQKKLPSADDINATYRAGYITAAERNDKMRRLAGDQLANILLDQGYAKAMLHQTVKHIQEGWDNFVEATTAGQDKSVGENFKNYGKAIWGEIQILTSAINAFGEVNGKQAELWALDAGASPGLAKVINVSVDVGSGFLPIGAAARSLAKGIQGIGKAVKGAQAVGEAAKVAEAAQTIKQVEKIAQDALQQGLKAEGVIEQGVEGAAKIAVPADDFYKALRAFKREMEGITATKSHTVTLAEAEKLGLTIEDLKKLPMFKALSEAEMAGFLKALDGPTDNLIGTAKRVLAGEADAGPILDKMLIDYFGYTPKFRASEVTAGRAVEILKETPPMKAVTNMLKGWDPESMAKLDLDAARRTMAEDILALADEPGKLKALQIQGAEELAKGGTWWDKAKEVYINTLLARPLTQVRNFLGNSFAALTSATERELGGWLSIEEKGLVRGGGAAQIQGMTAALGDGFKAFADAYKRVSPEEMTKLDFIPHLIPGKLGRIINVPTDTLRGMDNFFKTVLARGDMYATAITAGTHQGLTGQKLADYVARRMTVPTEEMFTHAKAFALEQTFQNDLGTIGKHAQRLLQSGPLALLFPFMKTPINLAKYAWNRTPGLQFLSQSLYADILAGGARADMAIGRLTLSNMMGMFWYGLAQQGLLTGGGPVDPQLRKTWMATKQPYSIMGKGGWYPLTNIEPATTPLGLIADFAEIRNQLDDPTAEQTAMAIALSGTRDIVDKTYWQTVGDAVELLGAVRVGEEPGPSAMRILTGPAVTMASGGPLMSSIKTIVDPLRREARGVVDQVRSRVWGYSEGLKPLRDGYGDPILIPQAIANPWLGLVSPLTSKDYETDPVKKEGARLQVKIPTFPWSIGGKLRDDFDIAAPMPGDALPVELSAEERDRWQVIYKNILRHPETGIQKTLLGTPEYQSRPYPHQRELFMDYLSQARKAAETATMVENPVLARKIMEAQSEKYLSKLTPSERPAAEQQFQEALGLMEKLLPEERDNLNKWGVLNLEVAYPGGDY
jgi:Sec-independent protein translocase protein TatA